MALTVFDIIAENESPDPIRFQARTFYDFPSEPMDPVFGIQCLHCFREVLLALRPLWIISRRLGPPQQLTGVWWTDGMGTRIGSIASTQLGDREKRTPIT